MLCTFYGFNIQVFKICVISPSLQTFKIHSIFQLNHFKQEIEQPNNACKSSYFDVKIYIARGGHSFQ